MSLPPSRGSSLLPPSRSSSTRIPSSSSNISLPTPKSEQNTGLSKLRQMFESTKAANFQATITIHELQNVPQLAGDFAVKWKFQGRRPRGKDAIKPLKPGHKPSLPNLRTQPLTTLHPSSSSTSISSRSTASSPVASIQNSISMSASTSGTTTPSLLSPNTQRQALGHRGPVKKSSDPTPLRQSTQAEFTASPEAMTSSNPSQIPTPDGLLPPPAISNGHPLTRTNSSDTTTTSSKADKHALSSKHEHESTHRKGTTPVRPLKAHTCSWEYGISHTIRIPLGKPIEHAPGTATPGSRIPGPRSAAPCLGNGPQSESGLRLIIQQLPTAAATSHGGPSAVNKDSLTSMVTAAHHAADGKGNPSERSHHADSEKQVFGIVDIDLAAFAGRGKTSRRFLLKGSRTNATIKLTVEMKWVGGDERWAAPPLKEGHHVTGMKDLLDPDVEERSKSDLAMARTDTTSSASSVSGSHPSSLNLSQNPSMVSLVNPAPQINYKSFEHHLKPPPNRDGASTPSDGRHLHLPKLHLKSRPHSPHPHRGHLPHHLHEATTLGLGSTHDLPPEVIIEAIFNPHASSEETPFTYVPTALHPIPTDSTAAVHNALVSRLQNLEHEGVNHERQHSGGSDDVNLNTREGKMKWNIKFGKKERQRTVSSVG